MKGEEANGEYKDWDRIQQQRVSLYADRIAAGLDLFTGQPLPWRAQEEQQKVEEHKKASKQGD